MKRILWPLLSILALTGMAEADGLTLKLEGGVGIIDFKDTGIFLLERDAPPSDVFFTDLEHGMPRGPMSSYSRGEVNFDIGLPTGQTLRFGGIWSEMQGNHDEVTPVYFWVDTAVRYSPDGEFTVVHGRVVTCPLVDGQSEPCATFTGSLDRGYHETMPEILLGQTADDRMTWVGLQAFSGRLDETTAGMVEDDRLPSQTIMTELGADATGVMLAFQQERLLPSGARLTLGLGLGTYRMTATGLSYIEGERNPNATRHQSFYGKRAQLSAGIEYPLSDRLSLGGTIRADLWSDQPRIDADLPDTKCIERLVCHQHVPTRFDLTTDPFKSVSVALSLTFRM